MEEKDLIRLFAASVRKEFEPLLKTFGFRTWETTREKQIFVRSYINGPRFVRVSASTHFRDGGPEFSIEVGQGPTKPMMAREYNQVSIPWLRRVEDPEAKLTNYPLVLAEDGVDLSRALEDFQRLAGPFLEREFTSYKLARQLRSEFMDSLR